MNARALLAGCLIVATLPVMGQEGQVIGEQQVDAAKLVDALAPREPVRTRSLGIVDDEINSSSPSRGRAKVSLLITFVTNSANLTASAKQSLDTVGQALSSDKLVPYRFAIEGHADPRGSAAANLKLSQMRAQSVRDYLIGHMHIDRSRLDAIGKGSRELMNTANPEAPENRRVTIVNLSH
jgi:outer membrane protein OmpA-like peptidoglycan-associated protein